MEITPYSELKKGTFLIASPEINEGIFFRSVVLLCDHTPVGSIGLIINKPVEIETPNDVLSQEDLRRANIHIRAGGPNEPNQMMLIHSAKKETEKCFEICEGVYLGGSLEFLQEAATEPNPLPVLMCLGYGGWGVGFLEREFQNGIWFTHPASKRHIFETPPETLWQTILKEMGGKYKTLSMIPNDLDLN